MGIFRAIVRKIGCAITTPWCAGFLGAVSMFALSYAINASGRASLLFLGIAGLLGGVAIFLAPYMGAALIAFQLASNISFYLPSIFSLTAGSAIAAVLARKLIRHQTTLTIPPVLPTAIIFFAWHLTTILWAGAYDQLAPYNYIRIVLVLLVCAWAIELPRHVVMVLAFAALGLLVSVFGVMRDYASYLTSGALESAAGRASEARFFGTWEDPNIMGQSAVPFIALSYLLFRTQAFSVLRMLGGFAVLLGIIGVIMSQSRGALLLLTLVFIVIFVADANRKWIILTSSIALTVIFLFTPIDALSRITSLFRGSQDGSLTQRSEMLWGGMQIAWDYFPFGCGSGNIGTYAADYSMSMRRGLVSHNGYVDILAESGPVGIMLILLVFWITDKNSRVSHWRIHPSNPDQSNLVVLKLAMYTMILVNLFSSYLLFHLLWFLLGLVSVYPSVCDRARVIAQESSNLSIAEQRHLPKAVL